jgi:hypothetical protein
MQLSATWRFPIDVGADACDVGPKHMDDDVCSKWLRLIFKDHQFVVVFCSV